MGELELLRTRTVAGVRVVVLSGEVDTDAAASLHAELTALAESGQRDLVADLSGVRLLTVAGARVLWEIAALLAEDACRVRFVAGPGAVRKQLSGYPVGDALDVYDTVELAVAACTDAAARREDHAWSADAPVEVRRLAQEVRDLRAKLASRPIISRALGMLQERYRLDHPDQAFRLLSDCSQDRNLKVHHLAAEIVAQPRPVEGRPWPHRPPAPELPFLPNGGGRATVEDVVGGLARELASTAPGLACQVWLTGARGPRLAAHHGLPGPFARVLAGDRDGHGAIAAAIARRCTVVVANPAEDPLYAGTPVRDLYAAHQVAEIMADPLLAPDGEVLGAVAVQTSRPSGLYPHHGELRGRWETVGGPAGAWLAWDRRDALLAGLEHLHRTGLAR